MFWKKTPIFTQRENLKVSFSQFGEKLEQLNSQTHPKKLPKRNQ
jgi:hypothetical protein